MIVILFMARETILGRAFELTIGMALRTFRICVRAIQLKVGAVMIKT